MRKSQVSDFEIVLQELDRLEGEMEASVEISVEADTHELEDIRVLREITQEITMPPNIYYTLA